MSKVEPSRCARCGADLSHDDRFCSTCGADVTLQCRICNCQVEPGSTSCEHCGFDLKTSTYLRTLTSSLVPPDVGERVLRFLNQAGSAEEIYAAVDLLGEADTGVGIARNIFAERTRRGKFSSLAEVESVKGLGPARFTELILALGTTPRVVIPDLSQAATQPVTPRFSASITELEFDYKILAPGPLQGAGGHIAGRWCTTCQAFAPSFNRELDVWESQVEITGLIFHGEDANIEVQIQMDMRMQPYDWMHPLDKTAKQFQFPAKLQLNNSMLLRTRVKATGQMLDLVSRDVPCQVGRITNWPPYGVRLHTQREIRYHDATDPLATPLVELTDGTTYLLGPCYFFAHRADIIEYEYVASKGIRDLPAVKLSWKAMPKNLPGSEFHDHYHVYRSANPELGRGSWVNVSGHVKETTWIDPNPPKGPLYYRVLPVIKTPFGEDYEGFPGQARRVEPAISVFRV